MAMEYDAAIEVIKGLPNGADILETLTEKVHKTNSEAKGLREQKIKAEAEAKLKTERALKLEAALKALEIDPDDDIGSQFQKKLSGTKPASEFETAMKEIAAMKKSNEKLIAQLEETQKKADQATQESILNSAFEKFSPELNKAFDKNSDVVRDLLRLKGLVVVKEGQPGVVVEDEFIPLVAQKGPGAIDKIKAMYPQLAITKQTSGGNNVRSTTTPGSNNNANRELTRKEFDVLPGPTRIEYMAKVGRFAEGE